MRRKERKNGRTRIEEVKVWEKVRLRTEKSFGERGKFEAWKRDWRWKWIFGRRGEKGTKVWERRVASEKGRARRAEMVKYW